MRDTAGPWGACDGGEETCESLRLGLNPRLSNPQAAADLRAKKFVLRQCATWPVWSSRRSSAPTVSTRRSSPARGGDPSWLIDRSSVPQELGPTLWPLLGSHDSSQCADCA